MSKKLAVLFGTGDPLASAVAEKPDLSRPTVYPCGPEVLATLRAGSDAPPVATSLIPNTGNETSATMNKVTPTRTVKFRHVLHDIAAHYYCEVGDSHWLPVYIRQDVPARWGVAHEMFDVSQTKPAGWSTPSSYARCLGRSLTSSPAWARQLRGACPACSRRGDAPAGSR
ncbi:hypothetical protein OG558_23795 [Kribbella sp. NBC_01510]|uniref:hypothetical protein n=1 Tax=Kribbella sp. NBC_01510 TaxID=2903581 RepID=UPI003870CB73